MLATAPPPSLRMDTPCPDYFVKWAPGLQLPTLEKKTKLSRNEMDRYSRQLLVSRMGIKGQLHLRGSSVLVIGAGGLGCPLGMYLAGMGFGRIGVVDGDVVETTNLHRQISHGEDRIGMNKALSLCLSMHTLNSDVEYVVVPIFARREYICELINTFDIVCDCTDNPFSRYLVNDACVFVGKPLVSGAAVRAEGYTSVYNVTETSPCLRCIAAPPVGVVARCSNEGILPPVVGMIACAMAQDTLSLAVRENSTAAPDSDSRLQMVDGRGAVLQLKTVGLRRRQASCVCQMLRKQELPSPDYFATFLLDASTTVDLDPLWTVTAEEYAQATRSKCHFLLDVRDKARFKECGLASSVNIPLLELSHSLGVLDRLYHSMGSGFPLYVICRSGEDSAKAVKFLREKTSFNALHIGGGLLSYAATVDTKLMVY